MDQVMCCKLYNFGIQVAFVQWPDDPVVPLSSTITQAVIRLGLGLYGAGVLSGNIFQVRLGTIYEDVTTDVLGEIGSWQWLVTFLSSCLMVPCFFNPSADMFLLHASTRVSCVPPPETLEDVNISLCNFNNGTHDIACTKWQVKILWMGWYKKNWLVFCDDNLRLLSTAVICRLGLGFGCVIFGLVADSFGRKSAIAIDLVAEVLLSLVLIFCDSEGWFRLIVFLKSLFGSASLYMGLIIVGEIASNRWRTWLSTFAVTPRLLAMVCVVPLANIAPNVETYMFICCLLGFALIAVLRWIPESPQWLLYNRKINSAEKMLHKAAIKNGYQYSGEFKIRPVDHRAYICLDEPTTCLGILATYNIRVIVFVTIVIWCFHYFLWGSLYLRVYSGPNVNSVLIGIMCCILVMGALTLYLSAKTRLRRLQMVITILAGAYTTSMTYSSHETIQSLLSSLAIAGGVVGHALLLNITPRLFAINVRCTLIGSCHAAGELGAIASYLLYLFHVTNDTVLVATEIVLSLLLVWLYFVLPDVDGREMPDMMEDMDYFTELSKPLRWATQKSRSPSKEEVVIKIYSFGNTVAGRVVSSHHRHQAEEAPREPARRIGFVKLWNMFKTCMRGKCRRSNHVDDNVSPSTPRNDT